MDIRPNARVVVLVELADGTLRAIDGNGDVDISMHREDDLDFEMFYNPKFLRPLKTKITVEIVGKWTMYQSNYPQRPASAEEIEAVGQIENKRKQIEPGDYDFEW